MQNDNNYPQLIITGRGLTADMTQSLRTYLTNTQAFAVDFVHPTGDIGYIDGATKEITAKSLKEELSQLGKLFKKVEIAVTLMSGPPGQSNRIIVSYILKNGQVKEDICAHVGHGPPKRYKKTST